MLLVDPSADVGLFQSLGNLQNALPYLNAAPAAPAVSDEFDRRRTDFLSIKADIVLRVCFRYGLQLLRQKKHKLIAQVMLERVEALLTRQKNTKSHILHLPFSATRPLIRCIPYIPNSECMQEWKTLAWNLLTLV